jgi:hypothetical protein
MALPDDGRTGDENSVAVTAFAPIGYPIVGMRMSPWSLAPLIGSVLCTAGCAGGAATSASPQTSTQTATAASATTGEPMTRVVHDNAGSVGEPKLVGARCPAGEPSCRCRTPGDDAETIPPPEGMKRLEIRMSVHGGEGLLQSAGVGRFAAVGVKDTCFYVDVPAGSKSSYNFQARASNPDVGHTPRLSVWEYGPAGPFWYEIFSFTCVGVGGKCDAAGVAAWQGQLKARKRGRMDPCGSLVVTGLDWQTSGGLAHRDNGYYRDFSVRFDAEVKKFPTQFAPHSTECVPK